MGFEMILQYTPPTLHLTPRHHGRRVSLEDFENSTGDPGYKYELIDGRIYVSAMPDPPQDLTEMLLFGRLFNYRLLHPDVIDHVTPKARVFVPGRTYTTCPEPDLSAYRDYPHELVRKRLIKWNQVSPILVAEIVSKKNAKKDFVRNVEMYEQVPSIREYWILSDLDSPGYPALTVYRKRGRKWQKPIVVSPGETYTTRLLPGFELKLDAPEE
jgi:Uma2 family endonuclease